MVEYASFQYFKDNTRTSKFLGHGARKDESVVKAFLCRHENLSSNANINIEVGYRLSIWFT